MQKRLFLAGNIKNPHKACALNHKQKQPTVTRSFDIYDEIRDINYYLNIFFERTKRSNYNEQIRFPDDT